MKEKEREDKGKGRKDIITQTSGILF